ncbi:meiotically up-regulated gene 184 protein [Arachis stenosperma]|uniref:meiotically up-regulated gene 184 protein n=1 Tax=Arachis stenosperma TaxID=217475 RepID=UPI0025AD7DC5|nr:meiotically up-regulated gene 184 protein [Arachis stenosperma]
MGIMGQDSDSKTQLVLQICSIATRSVVCAHRFLSNSPNPSSFIDWYCILGVEENAGINTIRKRYHKLALQLHPDKNQHPKAEIAFKLVSEAYTCLSNAAKRRAFDLERLKSLCFECKRIPNTSSNAGGSGFKAWNIINISRSFKLWRNIRDMRERFKEEAKVIENCLRANSMSRKESPPYNPVGYLQRSKSLHRFDRETPVFNPSDYLYQGYPHLRSNVYKNSSTYWYLQTESMLHNAREGAQHGSPIFEVKSRSMFTSKFAQVPSQC